MDDQEEKQLAKDIAKELKDQVMKEFYENVGKSVVKKLFGLLLAGIGAVSLYAMVRLGILKI